jgi:hypothetical protein
MDDWIVLALIVAMAVLFVSGAMRRHKGGR